MIEVYEIVLEKYYSVITPTVIMQDTCLKLGVINDLRLQKSRLKYMIKFYFTITELLTTAIACPVGL